MAGGKPKNAKATVGRLFKYLSGSEVKLIIVVICALLSTLLGLAASYILRPVINDITSGDGAWGKLVRGCILMAVIYILSMLIQYAQQRIMIHVSQNSIQKLRNDLFSKLQTLPVKYYDTNANGDIMSRFTNDVDAIGDMMGNTVVQLFTGVIQIVGTLGLMIYTNWILTLITIATAPFLVLALNAITKRSRKYYRSQQAAIGTLNGYIEETVTGQKVVKDFNHEDTCVEEFALLNDDLRDKQFNAQFYGGIMGPVMGNTSQISYAVTVGIGGILMVAGSLTPGALTVFAGYSRQFAMPINQLSMQMSAVFSALAGATRVFAVMDAQPEEPDRETAVSREIKGDIVLDHVTFGYVPEKTVLPCGT